MREINEFTTNYFNGGTNVLAAVQPLNMRTNRSDYQHRRGHHTSSAIRGSRWAETEALRLFHAQSRQFDRGSKDFLSRTRPSIEGIIARTTKVSRRNSRQQQHRGLSATALELAQAESSAARAVRATFETMWKEEKYGHAPREKPAHSIRIVMENFNSLRVTSGNSKINAINNLLCDFKADMLCGCETQVDWRMVPQDWRFHNLFGRGAETRSIVAHNINERMRTNQFGGCAIMALGTLSPQVIGSGVDTTCLGRWCWVCLGIGAKTTRVIMAYQPSNSG
jgi:hypothetical protein